MFGSTLTIAEKMNQTNSKSETLIADNVINLDLIFELLKDQGTLEQTSAFLRSKGLAHSANNWEDMIEKRFKPSLKKGKLSTPDLFRLLAEVEEHGRQHIFIYELAKNKSVADLFDKKELNKRIKNANIFPELNKPSLVEKPGDPTVVEIRYESRGNTRCLVMKIVEERFYSYNKRQSESEGKITITYDLRPYRAINLVRIWESGTAEVRIYSHREAMNYLGIANAMWSLIAPIVDSRIFRAAHLDDLRDSFWRKSRRKDIKTQYVLRNSDHKNAAGNRIRASASAIGSTMFLDSELVASVDRFHSTKSRAQCERAAVTLKSKPSGGILSRDVNLLFHGAPNEFTITGKVTRIEYEYIFDTVVNNNK